MGTILALNIFFEEVAHEENLKKYFFYEFPDYVY